MRSIHLRSLQLKSRRTYRSTTTEQSRLAKNLNLRDAWSASWPCDRSISWRTRGTCRRTTLSLRGKCRSWVAWSISSCADRRNYWSMDSDGPSWRHKLPMLCSNALSLASMSLSFPTTYHSTLSSISGDRVSVLSFLLWLFRDRSSHIVCKLWFASRREHYKSWTIWSPCILVECLNIEWGFG